MNMKFFGVAVGDSFYIDRTPKPTPQNPRPARVLVTCQKASAITYIDTTESMLGEVGYDPAIGDKIVTKEELAAEQATKKKAKKKVAKKAPAKKTVKKAAKKATAKTAAKKTAKKPVKKASRKR